MNRLQLLLAFLIGLGGLSAQAPQNFRVGTWNLEFLGADPQFRRDTPPRDAADLDAIGRHIRELGVAVLAVQEICGEAPLQQVCLAMGSDWRHVLGTTGGWDDGKTQQAIGFVYDGRQVELLHAEELLELPREHEGTAVFHRKPVTACFRHRATGCDFRLVTVHLKAGTKDQDRLKRRLEATLLRAWLDRLLADPREDRDIAILGDFNAKVGDEPEAILVAGDVMLDLLPARPTATILHFDEQIDHVLPARSFAEIRADSLQVHGVEGEAARLAFRKTFSDHFPVTVTLSAVGDDDPDQRFRRGDPQQSLPAGERAVLATASWPPAPGTELSLRLTGATTWHKGRLLVPWGTDPEWIVLEADDGSRQAFARSRIEQVIAP